MKIEKFFQEDHQVKLTVEFDRDSLESAKRRAARQIAQKTRIPGFRPGKAPYQVVLRTVGEGAVVQEALDLLIDEQYPTMLDEAEIKAYGPGSLSNIVSIDPPTLEFLVPLQPTVAVMDYSTLRFPYELAPVTEEDVDQTLEDLRDRDATYEPVDRPAEVGDQVTLRLSAERKNAGEGEEKSLIQERQTALTVNAPDADVNTEWPFTGFSRHLIGMSAGEEKDFEYTYPEDAYLEYLRGTEAAFHIRVESVKLRQVPEVNDEFAKKFGEYETLEALRSEIRQGLTEQRTSDYDRDYTNKIIDEIMKTAEIKYPPQLLEREVEHFKQQLENRLSQQNLDLETYMKSRQLDEAGLQAELKQPAEERLRRSLVIVEISRLEDIQVDQESVQNETIRTINQIQQMYKPEDAKRLLTSEFIQSMVSNISSDQMVQNTLKRLKSIAMGETQAIEESATPETVTEVPIEPLTGETAGAASTTEPVGEPVSPALEHDEKAKIKPAKKRKPRKEPENE